MQDYLSEVTARWLLLELARTTLLLAVLGVAAWLVLRLTRISSPTLHRVCCVVLLLAGWTFVRWPVDVAWYEAPPVVAEIAEVEPEPESFTPPIDPALLSPPPEFGAGMGAPALAAPEVDAATTEPQFARQPEPLPEVTPQPAWQIRWEQLAVAVWLIGIVAVVGWWLVGYLRFLWQMPRGEECLPGWQAEFAAACAEQGRAGRVEFRVTEDAGPLLCRLPRRTVLLVPRSMWRELDAVERRAILRHELEHLSRGDLWKSLAVRVLALPHWFNPVAWLAVRRFDDAAEWACDRAAMGSEPTTYAAMLLRLGELAGTRARFGSAMSNRPLTTRIRRLLTLTGTEDSAMKKACLMSLLLLVVPLALVRVNLVAEEPKSEPPRDQAELAQETPKPASDAGDGFLGFPTEEQVQAAAAENVPPAEPPRNAEPETPVKAAQRRMVEFARKTYEAQDAAYKAGTVTLDQVFNWSNLWLTAELAIAESREEQIAAAERNLARLKVVEANISRLYEQGSRGGEQNAMSAANYHVADAERRLAEIEAMPESQAKVPQPADDREMVDAAKHGFEATTAAYMAGQSTLEAVISWSNRWLAAELEIAASREAQLVAAQAHLERIRDLHTKVEALYRTGSNGGEANVMATSTYYLVDAKQRLAEIERKSSATNLNAATNSSVGSFYSAIDATGDTLKFLVMGKLYAWNDPAVVPALRTMLKQSDSSTVLAALMLTTARPSGQTIGARAELAPDLIQLLENADPQIRNYTEQTLLDMRPEIEAVLQEAAKSKKPEIAARVKSILDSPRQVQQAQAIPSSATNALAGLPQSPATQPARPSQTPKFVDPYAPRASRNSSSMPTLAPTTSEAVPTTGNTFRRSREFREGMPTLAEERPQYYDGKTFEQWHEQLQTDLSPTLRKEAMYAMAEFAAHGYGKEAAEVLFDTMRDYSVWALFEDSPDGNLKNAAVEAALRIPAAERLPAVLDALRTGNKNQKLFALRIVPLDATKAEIVPPLVEAVGDADRDVVELARAPLALIDHGNAALIASIRRGLSSTDGKEVHNAVWLARGCPHAVPGQNAIVSEPFPELLPEALELLDHDDTKIRESAAAALTSTVRGPSQIHYVEALERIASSGEGAAAVNARKILDRRQ